ncbi:MAG TPA: hypothetical protein VMW66_02935 [Elusimicrobiales bacterium]|nr:hypothetical protein [Elusimicrobiales bacterium]
MNKKIIVITASLIATCVLLKVYAQKASHIAVSPIARVKISDVYDIKKHPNPFMSPKARNKPAKKTILSKKTKKTTVTEKIITFNYPTLNSFRLTGLMMAGKEKQAILYDLNTRQTYYLITGKLYDRDIKIVKGFSGKVLLQSVELVDKDGKKRIIPLPSGIR